MSNLYTSTHINHIFSSYFAPRGRSRIYDIGMQFSQIYLSPEDKLVGVIGEPGCGKSALIRGMFPGLELTNDDDGVNVRPLPLLEQDQEQGFFTPHTYHVDIRFEMGFTQLTTLVDAIRLALRRGKRVIVEHFELIYPFLKQNADLLIGIGEEILVTRPRIFGPLPQDVAAIVRKSLPYRLMAHTAEDLCEFCMPKKEVLRCQHGDVRHGFTMEFLESPPEIDLVELEEKVNAMIRENLPITYLDETHISINGAPHMCTGPRTHVRSTGEIVGFRLLHHFVYEDHLNRYLMVGCVGEDSADNIDQLGKLAP